MNPIRLVTARTCVALVGALALAASQRAPAAETAPAAPPAPAAPAGQTAAQQASRAEMERQLATAQKELEVAANKVAELSRQMGAEAGNRFFFAGGPPRAMLGVQLSNEEGQGGAKVMNVSPGGPAAEAGIKAGDLITSIGGEDLTRDSNPSRALQERMSQIDPKLKVQVGVLREGRKLTVDLTPRATPDMMWGGPGTFNAQGPRGPRGGMPPAGVVTIQGAAPMPGMPGMAGMSGAGVRTFTLEREDGMGQRFHGMEFATLSEQLGSYFGVKSGVLVVRAGSNQAFKLKDGDVIVAIDGREPTSAQHAGRILRSYQAGEKLSIRIQRDRKAQNIEVTVPSGRDD